MYSCDKCDYTTTDSSNFKRHCFRKTPCNGGYILVGVSENISKMSENVAHEPENVAHGPENVAHGPENVSFRPEFVSGERGAKRKKNMGAKSCKRSLSVYFHCVSLVQGTFYCSPIEQKFAFFPFS